MRIAIIRGAFLLWKGITLTVNDVDKRFHYSGIYLITNMVNGKKYVGQAQDLCKRFSAYRGGRFNRYMKAAVNKYGIENFSVTFLEEYVPLEELDSREQYWMDYYHSASHDCGYNIAPTAGSNRGVHHSEEARQRMSANAPDRHGANNSFFGKHHSDETKMVLREKCGGANNYWYGKHLSDEHKRKIGAPKIGKPRNEITKAKLRDARLGKELSDHTKQLISQANQGKTVSPETRAKISNALRGRKRSEETLQKLSAARKGTCTKSVAQIDTHTGNVICVWKSIQEAADTLKLHATSITRVAKGKMQTTGGFAWQYADRTSDVLP